MYAYFDRDNVALRGLARYFSKQSDDERKHAEQLMEFQNRRGGRVRLATIPMPLSDFDHAEKGDALNVRTGARALQRVACLPRNLAADRGCTRCTQAMELALSLEKLNYQKLVSLDKAATDAGDFNLADYVDTMLDDQTEDVKRAADYVSQLRRVGKGHGTWAWDQQLYDDYD